MTFPIDASYLISNTRFRVDSNGTCTDQRQETIDALSKHFATNFRLYPLKITYARTGPPYAHFELKIPLSLLKGPFNC